MEYYKTKFKGCDVSIRHIGGNYNYGIYDVFVRKDGKTIYANKKYYYNYISFGATYFEVMGDIFRNVIDKLY